jgi:hypothetical protein
MRACARIASDPSAPIIRADTVPASETGEAHDLRIAPVALPVIDDLTGRVLGAK